MIIHDGLTVYNDGAVNTSAPSVPGNVRTGDQVNLMLWGILCVMSLGIARIIGKKRYKRVH